MFTIHFQRIADKIGVVTGQRLYISETCTKNLSDIIGGQKLNSEVKAMFHPIEVNE